MIKDYLRTWRYRAPAWGWRAAHAAHLVQPPPEPIAFVTENADWAIRRVGEYIRYGVNAERPESMTMTSRPDRLAERVVHFGSQYMWLVWGRHMARSNRYAVSFFHGKPEDGPEVAAHIERFLDSVPRLDRIVASAGIVEARLKNWGVPGEKIVRIPIGVDTGLFLPPSEAERAAARAALGFLPEQVVIGSFQKDGVGWGDGMEPKLIKGPDVFLEAIDRLRGQIPVAVLLTGPARGFVKAGLEKMGVPYRHRYVKAYEELKSCYHALDLYFVTSREEGGPMGLMESMASHVPVVSTPVGMAPDLLTDGVTGGLVDVVDARAVADSALKLLTLPEDGRELRAKALDAVQCCAWPVVARSHLDHVYEPLMAR